MGEIAGCFGATRSTPALRNALCRPAAAEWTQPPRLASAKRHISLCRPTGFTDPVLQRRRATLPKVSGLLNHLSPPPTQDILDVASVAEERHCSASEGIVTLARAGERKPDRRQSWG